MIFSLPSILTPIDEAPPPPPLSSSLRSLAITTIVSTALYCPNAAGNTLKKRAIHTSFFIAGWACFSLSLRFIPLTQLARKYLAPNIDTTVAFVPAPIAVLYRLHLLSEDSKNTIRHLASKYLKSPPKVQKKPEVPLFTAKEVLLGSIALCASAIFLKKSLRELTNEATAIHYVASSFFACALLYPFKSNFTLSVVQLVFPYFTNCVADARDFYADIDEIPEDEKRAHVIALSYAIQQVRDEISRKAHLQMINSLNSEEMPSWPEYPSNLSNTKTYIAIALGIIGTIHYYKPFTMPKIPLQFQEMTRIQKCCSYLFNDFAYPFFSHAIHQVVSAIFNA